MLHCYRCGRALPAWKNHIRRQVKTGEYIDRRHSRGSVAKSTIRYGQRIVCEWCAKEIDREHVRKELRANLTVLLAVLALAIFILVKWLLSL